MKLAGLVSTMILVSFAACKTVSDNSTTQGVLAAPPPSWGVSRSAPIENIRYILKPAKPNLPMAKYLGGILYLHGEVTREKMGLISGAVAMTLDGAQEVDNTLSIPLYDKTNYAYRFNPVPDLTRAPGSPAYRIILQDDKHAILVGGSWVDGQFKSEADKTTNLTFPKMTLEYIDEFHWVRHTAGLPDYDIYTIIDQDGKETPYYRVFLSDAQSSGYKKLTFYAPANSDWGRGGALPTAPDLASPVDPDRYDGPDNGTDDRDNKSDDSSKDAQSKGNRGR